jgi:Family of unknown function (DUF6191)
MSCCRQVLSLPSVVEIGGADRPPSFFAVKQACFTAKKLEGASGHPSSPQDKPRACTDIPGRRSRSTVPGMAAGTLFALTLPGLVVLLVALGVAESLWSRPGRRSPVFRRERHALSAGGLDVFSASLAPGRAVDLEQQRAREILRDDVDDGAPPYGRIDLDRGVAYLDVPSRGRPGGT